MTEKKKIAIVDDEEIQAKALSEELRDAGFEVVMAFDGEQGLALVKKEMPDFVVARYSYAQDGWHRRLKGA